MSIRKFIEYKYKEKQIISRLLPVHFFYNSKNFDDLSLQNKNGNGIQAEERREKRESRNWNWNRNEAKPTFKSDSGQLTQYKIFKPTIYTQ